ncbi:MAG: bifunctional (p)ppGpp synthetase/guanosine-3',5'-bis(diphosphate) 3'-pyrophosphohydrolase [Bacteroidaceae bacterium]|nr:bifunctional (p)ppGpp synthetase/guanosine-3',5'-bis(diphosphate) 3'-pyrophosphohydrolase [Bacteroidaceae bacterium]
MEERRFFSETERAEVRELYSRLARIAAPVLREGDAQKVRTLIRRATEEHRLNDDVFGLNPVIVVLETARLMCENISVTRASLLGGLLHLCVESGVITEDEVRRQFGDDVAIILSGLKRVAELYSKTPTVESENFRTLLISFAQDMRVILIMIANRVYVMRQIKDTPHVEEQRRVASEAAYLWAPLAHKLGLYTLKRELEDLSLKYLEHDAYYHIKDKLNETKASRDAYIERFITPLQEKLEAAGLKFHIKGRTKSIHSIWQKMKKQKVDVEGIYDLFAIRVILDSEPKKEYSDCWLVYGILGDMYQPNPRRMRDWLSVPKSNGYESLHITVLGPEQKWVEVQIRTERMDDIAEHGLAAHWRYKGVGQGEGGVDDWLAGIRSALEAGDDMALMDQFRADLKEDEVFVFTPKGDLFKLPAGATVLDFAYAIHTKVGDRCVGAKIGGRNIPLRTPLNSGDTVEILTREGQIPRADWLSFVTTAKAKNKIRQTLKEAESRQAEYAKELVERKFKNRKIEYDEPTFMHVMTRMGYHKVTDFYLAIAEEKVALQDFIDHYIQRQKTLEGTAERAPIQSTSSFTSHTAPSPSDESGSVRSDVLTIDQNMKGIQFTLAKCCQPIYGDPVFGFVTTGGGVKIHRQNCPNATQLHERFGYRIVPARWSGKDGSSYPITLRIVGHDDMGIVNNITSVISKEEKVMMRGISIDTHDGLFAGTLTVLLDDTSRLTQLIRRLQTIRGVKSVERI